MIKKLNTVFFSICFLAALIAENYCIQRLDEDLVSVVGIGIVVLIMGYLLLDSIRNHWKKSYENIKFVLEKTYQEETEKWNERFTELSNLQKATYTATKKNTELFKSQLDQIITILESNERAFAKITELQKKSLEGQKNALNLEINYNKENTKQLIRVLHEVSEKKDYQEEIRQIVDLLGKNRPGEISADRNIPDVFLEEPITETKEPDLGLPVSETVDFIEPEAPTIVPLYDDPNKSLTADEIAKLFASVGK
jgi:Ca2+-binding EF-hand superfamily protein